MAELGLQSRTSEISLPMLELIWAEAGVLLLGKGIFNSRLLLDMRCLM